MWEMILELGGEFLAVLFGLVFTLGLPVAGIYLLVTGRSRDEQRIGRYLSLRGDRFLGCETRADSHELAGPHLPATLPGALRKRWRRPL